MGGACLRWTGVAYTQGGLHGKLIGTFRKCRSKAGVAYGQVALSTGFTVVHFQEDVVPFVEQRFSPNCNSELLRMCSCLDKMILSRILPIKLLMAIDR